MNFGAQSATEYLVTYGWALLIVFIVIASLYLFVFAPSTLTASTCTFNSGVYCQDLVLGSSSSLSKMAILITNSNPYPISNPRIALNLTGIPAVAGSCVPNFVLQGGAIICNATITPAISQGALSSGKFVFSYTPCPGGNVVQCSGNARQSYAGLYNTHASPLLSPTTVTVALSAQNSSQASLLTSLDKLTAAVKLLGAPLSGATVNFTSNSISAQISPLVTTTDGNGNAASYISSAAAGTVLVTASFANISANTLITFTTPACYTILVSGMPNAAANALTIDGNAYSTFPVQLCFGQGTSHSYSFQTIVSGGTGTRYLFASVSGCGANAQSGTLSGATNCTLTATYSTQYFLTTSAAPAAGGVVTPSSGWYNSGSGATLGETPSAGYSFSGWVGTGSGSYTGASTSPAIVMNNPISESGSFALTTSTSTTSTSTSTTSTTSSTSSTVTTTSTSTSTSTTTTALYIYCSQGFSTQTYGATLSPTGSVGSWRSGATYPTFEWYAECASSGSYTYCVGSQDGGGSSNSGAYSAPLTSGIFGAWSTQANYPTAIDHTSCVTSGGYLYCIGGQTTTFNGNFYTTVIQKAVYSSAVNSGSIAGWSSTTSYPITQVEQSCAAYNGYVYCVAGGCDGTGSNSCGLTTNLAYSAALSSGSVGAWSSRTSYPLRVRDLSCVADSGYLYCVGGVDPFAGTSLNLVYSAPISAGTIGSWSASTSLPILAQYPACTTSNGYIYCVGGYMSGSTGASSAAYVAPISGGAVGAWSASTPYPSRTWELVCSTATT
ncbi:MAG: hypothetical protein KGH53_03025 [Candidatus Micrarchaeota archaeon]|nr:hypothetical protein [Candidatus Micrarchaeota archaeon]